MSSDTRAGKNKEASSRNNTSLLYTKTNLFSITVYKLFKTKIHIYKVCNRLFKIESTLEKCNCIARKYNKMYSVQ